MAGASPAAAGAAAATREIPDAPGGFLLGCGPEIARDQLGYYLACRQQVGDFVRYHALGGLFEWYVLSHPDAVEHVLAGAADRWRKPDFFLRRARPLFGDGIVTCEGALWRRQRRLVAPAFQPARLAGMLSEMGEVVERHLARWERTHARAGEPFDLEAELVRITLDVAARIFFGADLGEDVGRLGDALRMTFEHLAHQLNSPFPAPMWMPTRINRAFRRGKRDLDEIVGRMIAARRARPASATGPRDILDALLAATDDEGDGDAMDDAQLRDEVITLLAAGHDTVAASLAWTFELLARHPEARAAVEQEAEAVLADGRPPAAADLERLSLTRRCYEEALRLYPPAWGQPRTPIDDDAVCGRRVPKGAMVVLMPWLVHRHPDFWERPERFDPDRFLPARVAARHRFAWFPFGGGPRVCPGKQLAMLEGPLVIAMTAARFRIERPPGAPPAAPDPSLTLRPRGGLAVRAQPRR